MARAAACAGLSSARAGRVLEQRAVAHRAQNNMGNRIAFTFLRQKLTGSNCFYRDVLDNLLQTIGNGLANKDRRMICHTPRRDTLTRCCNWVTLAARSLLTVRRPIKTGQAQAS